MKLYNKQPEENKSNYLKNVSNVASLSTLFASDGSAPYLVSRAAENIFCDSFKARNLGRDDTSIDAILDNHGIGIKTFLHNSGNTLQKVAEFNKDSIKYRNESSKEKVIMIANLFNRRLQFAIDNYEVESLVYHCITRKTDGTVDFYEIGMDFIDIKSIRNIKTRQNSIKFEDNINEYSFNLSKNTLFRRFSLRNEKDLVARINVKVIPNPYLFIEEMLGSEEVTNLVPRFENKFIILPLYSFNNKAGKFIGEKSGLNQWNAGGRTRHFDEVYIPIPASVHRTFPTFFPPRDMKFKLLLPNGKTLSAKVCQDNSKALMTDPNKDLGKWILRDVLSLADGELLSYDKLVSTGIDSVKITKRLSGEFEISFLEVGAYDDFAAENNL